MFSSINQNLSLSNIYYNAPVIEKKSKMHLKGKIMTMADFVAFLEEEVVTYAKEINV